MDSRDMLLRKEGDGKGYYQRCGAEAGVDDLSSIFRMLSEDELRHAEALRSLQSGVRVELHDSGTLEGARKILRRLSLREKALSGFHGDLGSYRHAMQFEAVSARACCELAREALNGWEKELLLRMAAEDEVHFTLLEQIHELLQPGAARGAGSEEGGGDA